MSLARIRALWNVATQAQEARKPFRCPTSVAELMGIHALFLVSPGRSGTKALVDFCSRYTNMHCVHAPKPWTASIGYLYHSGAISSEAAKYGFYAAREAYFSQAFQRQQVFFDGDCKNLPLSLLIADVMPNSKFIHLVRRPENFIRSGLARGYYKLLPPELWGHLTEKSSRLGVDWSLEVQIERIAYLWNEANTIAERAKVQLGSGRVITLIAEDMFDDPLQIIRALERLGLREGVRQSSSYTIRKLNVQKHNTAISPETAEMIKKVIARKCSTRSLYYGSKVDDVADVR